MTEGTLDKIFEIWEVDSKIDQTMIATASLKVAELQCKYQKWLSKERIRLSTLEQNFKVLYRHKYEFFTQGNTQESEKLGWKLPPRGCVLKADAAMYLESDSDLNDFSHHIVKSKECVRALEDILKVLAQRSFNIRNTIEFLKFQAGEM